MAATGIVLVLLAAGCSGGANSGSGSDRPVQAVASFYPLVEVTAAVGGERVGVSNLTPVGVEPHDIELSPRQIDRIAGADLLVYLGGGFQPAIEEAARGAKLAVDASRGLPVDGGDPHVWLDPVLFEQVVGIVEAALIQVDPAGADGYRARAAEYRTRLEQLDADYRAGLADCDRRVIVTAHEAFGYLARRYNLEQLAIAGISPDAEPDPRRLAELTDLVRQRGVTTVFTEELVSPKVAQTLAREAGVKTAVLHTLEGLESGGGTGNDYFSLMRDNLAALREALGCR
ncbi:MAG: zinc transport system substrate-binding protein [Actinomycetota bacterium]|jgi:zinc transport system substrate-binding protein|nr:zinc transport system substrate-binding protein [Actinomycetota bacterium]